MTTKARQVTVEELLEMPGDGFRHELVGGELKKMTPAGNKHGYLALEIASELRSHVKANGLGRTYAAETGFKISSNPDTVLAPDVAFVRQERLDEIGEVGGYWPGAPDLVVEVVSPNDRHSEVVEKAIAWLEAGCRLVLVADPERRVVTLYRSLENIRILTASDSIDGADVVPGWRLSLADIFSYAGSAASLRPKTSFAQ